MTPTVTQLNKYNNEAIHLIEQVFTPVTEAIRPTWEAMGAIAIWVVFQAARFRKLR